MQAVFHIFPDNVVLRSLYYNIQTFGLSSLCLKERLNTVQAIGLVLSQPALLLLFLFLFWLSARSTQCSKYLRRLQRGRCLVPVLWLIILWSYSSVAFTSMWILTCVKLGNRSVVFTDGSIECFGPSHLPFAVVAIVLIVVIVVGLPVLLMHQSFWLNHRLKGFMDEATHIYEDRFRWWCSANLFRRLVFAATAAATKSRQTRMVFGALILLFVQGALR